VSGIPDTDLSSLSGATIRTDEGSERRRPLPPEDVVEIVEDRAEESMEKLAQQQALMGIGSVLAGEGELGRSLRVTRDVNEMVEKKSGWEETVEDIDERVLRTQTLQPTSVSAALSSTRGEVWIPYDEEATGTWSVPIYLDVFSGKDTSSFVCSLSAGTAVHVGEPPERVKGDGVWVPIYGMAD
jgi:hypothetical protein